MDILGSDAFGNKDDFYKITKRIFSGCIKAKVPSMVLEKFQFGTNCNMVGWDLLEYLQIRSPIKFKSLVRLIYRLPNLLTLSVHDIELVGSSDIATLSLHSELQQLLEKPLDSKIDSLCVNSKNGTSEGMYRVIQSLLIQIKSLKMLVEKVYIQTAEECKSKMPYQYAHANDVKIQVWE
ncbi:hypothetical protein H4R24_000094 [Coemansia sp. RSA 988]|nr:hypothetical protein H4R24_000094 [Coemansia sp. RSA 988]